ncbi:MAG TPA: peptidylprolyl isomerase [Bacteroidales bacterium]|nr:peptidylprolyl isomerase [Bacteroidales bacterium]
MKSFLLSVLLLIPALIFPSGTHAQKADSVIDGVVAVVGENVILKSDIENQYLQYRMGGNIQGSPQFVKCRMLENMLFQKLLLHQAILDSAKVTDAQVEAQMDQKMRYFISQVGSADKLEEYYQKSIPEIKNELRDIIREQMMIQMTQEKLTKDVVITPSEVKAFYKKIPKDSIPDISSEIEIGMISKQPLIGDAEKEEARKTLEGFKKRIQNGDDFATLAILYSEDPGSAKQGGELGMFKRGEMHPEFEAAAFRLKPGEVSDIVETEDGYHLIQMIERRGDYINVRHILIRPKVSPLSLAKAKTLLDSVASLIEAHKITFEEAVQKYSDDPSRNNGGLMINQMTGTSMFDAKDLDSKIFFIIDKLKVGEISAPVPYKSERGKDEYRIYYLKKRTIPHKANLDEDYAKIEEWALDKKKSDVLDQWMDQRSKHTFVQINTNYAGCEFQRKWKFEITP